MFFFDAVLSPAYAKSFFFGFGRAVVAPSFALVATLFFKAGDCAFVRTFCWVVAWFLFAEAARLLLLVI